MIQFIVISLSSVLPDDDLCHGTAAQSIGSRRRGIADSAGQENGGVPSGPSAQQDVDSERPLGLQ